MLFKIVDVSSRSENESDYDTAVDICHYSMNEITYTLESHSGALIYITHVEELRSTTTLEVDFEEFEVTGNATYIPYDEKTDSTVHSYRIYAETLLQIPSMSPNQLKLFNLVKNVAISAEDLLNYPAEDQYAVWLYEQYLENLSFSQKPHMAVNVSEKSVKHLISQLYNIPNLKNGLSIILQLNKEITEEISLLDKTQEHILEENSKIRLNNQYSQAILNVDNLINKLSNQYLDEMRHQNISDNTSRHQVKI